MSRQKTYISLSDEECLAYVQQAYVDEGHMGQTSRHYYYKLLGYQAVQTTNHPNSAKQSYHYVCRLLVKARRRGLLPWEAVIDPGRRRTSYYSWDLPDYVSAKTNSAIRLDLWRGQQATGVEVWVEKDTMMTFVNSVVYEYRIPVQVNKGYGSVAAIKEASERYGNGKGWTLLYVGDFDPSGLDIDRALRDMLRGHGSRPNIVRIALSQADTENLMPNAGLNLKKKDPRTKKFVETYGEDQQAYEVDSLAPHLLRQRILEQLALYVDLAEFVQLRLLEQSVDTLIERRLRGTLDDLTQAVLSQGVGSPRLTLDLERQRLYLLPEGKYRSASEPTPDEDSDDEEEYDIEDDEEDDE